MPRLVLATRNQHKLVELRNILTATAVTSELVSADSFPEVEDVPETGLTFTENALIKARALSWATGFPALADDSGLCVKVLNGMPGVLSARWAGRHGDDQANLELLLAQLSDMPDEHRTAWYTCAAALVLPDGTERVTEGTLRGTLLREPVGDGGFAYDPIMQPQGETRTTAEMSLTEKNTICHRGSAFRALAPAIIELVG
ncbi:RdgB/HAM1 family non-canonical purine NTP pyrophosphatase [Streptomyces sp. Je 1-369]|uniref:RdgB/HAM1 family non-canonical purine NTP pyrophosphatase n=1 Tax=Streptomyces sp. Je 1-369 TaxID=2966192 RepID=UPI002286AC42|nr:RdgB/HAM1 family non-canonical purine NTP pyrophosphatase [Streptomyces sp. Je 1-369]WAM00013.1 RdgB/HAM1 family non-canonical purine NTP pyrophosphatase [Streptomyces sp. Je 1-369]